MGGSDNTGDGLASRTRRYRVPGQPLLNRHQVGGVSRSPDGLCAQQEGEPTRGRPAVRGKGPQGSPSPHPTPTPATHPGAPRSPHPTHGPPSPTQCTSAPPFRTIGIVAVEET